MFSSIIKLRSKTKMDYVFLLFMVTYASVFSVLSILKHNTFQTSAWDLGIYEQVLWSTLNGGGVFWYSVELPINPTGSFLGIHFSPILIFLLPIYWVFQATETLLILQSVFIALGALPLYLIAKEETNENAALVFAGAYFLYPPLHGMNLFDFHVQAFLPFLFLSALYFFRHQKWVLYFVFVILALMTIEFVPFIVIFLGMYGLWTCRRDLVRIRRDSIAKTLLNRRFIASMLTVVVATAWFAMAISVLFHFNPSPRPHPNWEALGDPLYDLPGLLGAIVINPIRTIQIMFEPLGAKLYYLVGLFAPLGFISFLSPPSLLIGTPWFFASLLSSYPNYYNPIGYQWVGFLIPFVFMSALYGSKRLMKVAYSLRRKKSNLNSSRIFPTLTTSRLFLGMILFSSIFLAFLTNSLTLPQITNHDRVLMNLTLLIPSNASVLTQNDIFPHLSRRLHGYVGSNPVGIYSQTGFDYVLVDTSSKWYVGGTDFSQLPLYTFVPQALKSGEYGLLTAVDGVWLLKRHFDGKPMFPLERGLFGRFNETHDFREDTVFESVFLDTEWDWTSQPPFPSANNDSWSATFSSYLNVPATGVYGFGVSTSGVCRLYVEGNLVFDSNESASDNTSEVFLQKGRFSLEIQYFKTVDPGTLKVTWKPPFKKSYELISCDNLLWNVSSD